MRTSWRQAIGVVLAIVAWGVASWTSAAPEPAADTPAARLLVLTRRGGMGGQLVDPAYLKELTEAGFDVTTGSLEATLSLDYLRQFPLLIPIGASLGKSLLAT